jgi:hypothetical protein
LLGELAQVVLFLCALLLGEALLHHGALANFFSRVTVGHKEGFGELGEVVVDLDVLQAAAIGGYPLVKGDRKTLGVLPHRNGGRCVWLARFIVVRMEGWY